MNDYYFIINSILPSVAGISTIFVGGSLLYSKFRHIVPVKVNCWFCNQDSNVIWKNRNSFLCSFCHQYNGFNEDGNYNRDIPAQYNEDLNFFWTKPKEKRVKTDSHPQENGLCQVCNLNQVFKIKALSAFSPVDESNYDIELDEFRKKLEDIYGLCRQCEAVIHQTLGKQNSWLKPKLIAWRLEHSKQLLIKGVSQVSKNPLLARIAYFLLFILSLTIIFIHLDKSKLILAQSHLLPINTKPYYQSLKGSIFLCHNIGFTIALMTMLFNGLYRLKKPDVFWCICWLSLVVSPLLKPLLVNEIFTLVQLMCSIATVLSTIWTAFTPPASVMSSKCTKRLIESPSCSFNQSSRSLDSSLTKQRMNNLSTPESLDGFQDNQSSISGVQAKEFEIIPDNHGLGMTLDGLKISTPRKREPPENFNPRSMFYEKERCKPLRESLLTPSKLGNKIVTQSSWVAGGYWGNTGSPRRVTQNDIPQFNEVKRDLFNHPSRSSSQSSGFISHQSGKTSTDSRNLFHSVPNSCRSSQSSLCGDKDILERQSVLSEPIFNRWGSTVSDHAASVDANLHRYRPLDAQSACSSYSQFSSASHNSPNAHSSLMYYNPLPHQEENPLKERPFLKHCNPWMAFILGLSVSANVFFFLILFKVFPSVSAL